MPQPTKVLNVVVLVQRLSEFVGLSRVLKSSELDIVHINGLVEVLLHISLIIHREHLRRISRKRSLAPFVRDRPVFRCIRRNITLRLGAYLSGLRLSAVLDQVRLARSFSESLLLFGPLAKEVRATAPVVLMIVVNDIVVAIFTAECIILVRQEDQRDVVEAVSLHDVSPEGGLIGDAICTGEQRLVGVEGLVGRHLGPRPRTLVLASILLLTTFGQPLLHLIYRIIEYFTIEIISLLNIIF